MFVPKVSNLDLGSSKRAIFRGEGGVMKEREHSLSFFISLCLNILTIEDKRGKERWLQKVTEFKWK